MLYIRILTLVITILFSSCFWYDNNDNKFINLRLNENPQSFDPHLTVDVTGGEVLTKIHSGLLRFNRNYEIVPDLASHYSIDNDGLVYTFTLKDDCRFSDGSILKSLHVKESFQRLLNKDTMSPRSWVLNRIEGADKFLAGEISELTGFRIIDDIEFSITLKEKFSPFAALLTMPQASVFKINEKDKIKKYIGAGPYLLDSFKYDQYIKLLPNKFYLKERLRDPIIYKILPEDSSAIAMQATNSLDAIKLPRQQAKLLKKRIKNSMIYEIEELNTYYLGFDLRKTYLTSSFRQAVAMAINKKGIINMVLGGQAIEAATAVPPVLLHDIDTGSLEISFQPDRARQFFQEKYNQNREFIFLVSAGRESVAAASVIQDNLKDIGIKVKLKIIEWSAYKSAIEKGEGDLFLLSWWADYADAENFLTPVFLSANKGPAGNRVHYDSTDADLFIKEISNSVSLVEKKDKVFRLLQLLKKDLPWIPLWHRVTSYAVSKQLKGFYPPPMYTMSKGISLQKTGVIRNEN